MELWGHYGPPEFFLTFPICQVLLSKFRFRSVEGGLSFYSNKKTIHSVTFLDIYFPCVWGANGYKHMLCIGYWIPYLNIILNTDNSFFTTSKCFSCTVWDLNLHTVLNWNIMPCCEMTPQSSHYAKLYLYELLVLLCKCASICSLCFLEPN